MSGRPGPEYRPPDQRGFLSPAALVALMLKRRRGELPAPEPQRREGFRPFIPLSENSGSPQGSVTVDKGKGAGITGGAEGKSFEFSVMDDDGQPGGVQFGDGPDAGSITWGDDGPSGVQFGDGPDAGSITWGDDGPSGVQFGDKAGIHVEEKGEGGSPGIQLGEGKEIEVNVE